MSKTQNEPESFTIELNHPGLPRDRFVVEQTRHQPVGWAQSGRPGTFSWIVVKVSVYRDDVLVWSGFITWSGGGSIPDLFHRVEVAMRKANGGGWSALVGAPGGWSALAGEKREK
jgi:hypothetical protein